MSVEYGPNNTITPDDFPKHVRQERGKLTGVTETAFGIGLLGIGGFLIEAAEPYTFPPIRAVGTVLFITGVGLLADSARRSYRAEHTLQTLYEKIKQPVSDGPSNNPQT